MSVEETNKQLLSLRSKIGLKMCLLVPKPMCSLFNSFLESLTPSKVGNYELCQFYTDPGDSGNSNPGSD